RLLHLARAYADLGKDSLAVVNFQRLVKREPRPDVLVDLARAYSRMGKKESAEKAASRAVEAGRVEGEREAWVKEHFPALLAKPVAKPKAEAKAAVAAVAAVAEPVAEPQTP